MPKPTLPAPAVTIELGLACPVVCPLAELDVVAAGTELDIGTGTPEGRVTVPF